MCNPQPTIITLLSQHQFLRFSHQNIESYPAGKTPRYRPWITASSLLLFSDDVMDGETAAQGYPCKSGCQVEHISRERSRVKPQSGKNLPEINKLLIKRLLFAHLGQ